MYVWMKSWRQSCSWIVKTGNFWHLRVCEKLVKPMFWHRQLMLGRLLAKMNT